MSWILFYLTYFNDYLNNYFDHFHYFRHLYDPLELTHVLITLRFRGFRADLGIRILESSIFEGLMITTFVDSMETVTSVRSFRFQFFLGLLSVFLNFYFLFLLRGFGDFFRHGDRQIRYLKW